MGKAIKPEKAIIEEGWFNVLLGTVVMMNALVVGLETDQDFLAENDILVISNTFFSLSNDLFLAIYIVELGMRLFSLGGAAYFGDYFNVLDFFLVMTGIIERIFFQGQVDEASMLRVLRLMRLGRLARLVRLVRFFTTLWLTVVGFHRALGTLFAALPILTVLCYFFALVGQVVFGSTTTWLFTDRYSPPFTHFNNTQYFGTVGNSMVTMFQIVTLSGWSDIARSISTSYPHMAIFFIFFIFIATYGILNVVVGSICLASVQTATENAAFAKERETERREALLHAIGMCFEEADVDNNGALDHKEVYDLLNRPRCKAAWNRLGLPFSEVPTILRDFDIDGDGEITRQEFVNGVVRLLGESKKKDIVKLQLHVTALTMRIQLFHERMNTTVMLMAKVSDNITIAFDATEEELRRQRDPSNYRLGKAPPLFRAPPTTTRTASEESDTMPITNVPLTTAVVMQPRLHRVVPTAWLPPGCPVKLKDFERSRELEVEMSEKIEAKFRKLTMKHSKGK